MNRQPHAKSREIIVANAIEQVVGELRLVDVADYIAFIRLEHFACLSDMVDSAAELFFMPGTLQARPWRRGACRLERKPAHRARPRTAGRPA